jgi:hypothetical protein
LSLSSSDDHPLIASRIRYLAACHEADNRENAVFDFFHEDVRHRHFFSGTEVLASGLQDAAALPASVGIPALEEAMVYKRERSLVYGAFFFTGASGRTLAAPLLTLPAELHPHGEDSVLLRISFAKATWNFPVLAEILGENANESLDALARRLPSPPFTEGATSDLVQLLSELFPAVAVEELSSFPKLVPEKEVRARRKGPLACLPAAAMALVENPRSSRGVLSELARVAAAPELSPPLRALLGEGPKTASAEPRTLPSLASIPAVLSLPQQKVLRSARSHPLTLIVGPPGTGKSYTVTALALEHVARGESVLVACRTEQALDVIESKLEAMLGETTPVLRGGSSDYARKLKEFLSRLLSGQLETLEGESAGALERRLARCGRRLLSLERRIEGQHRLEIEWGELLDEGESLGLARRLKRRLLEWRLSRKRPSWELLEELEGAEAERIRLASSLLHAKRRSRIAALLEKHRPELKRFSSAVRARTSSRQEALFSEIDLGVLLGAFPLWISTFRDLHRFVPFTPELFDLVVVDEATQCDMASPLPALFRARRAAVTGDPRQLRHVSFLSRDRQRRLREEAGLSDSGAEALDYRDQSLLDLVDDALSSQEQVAFLDEHYRSRPQIIGFSNREFYGDGLRIMTARPGAPERRAIEVRFTGGSRDEKGVNETEADALVREVIEWVGREQALPKGSCHSLGILSPFRDQADRLLGLATERLGLVAIEKHDLLVGTAYGFQGEERDVMFLSLALDPKSHRQAMRHVNQPDLFNVAVTRARAHQLLFTSIAASDCPADSLLRRYLVEAESASDADSAPSPPDELLELVAARLAERGLRVHRAFVAGGMAIDLVVERDGRVAGIDLVGGRGPFAKAIDLERYRMFHRAGLPIFPLPFSFFRSDENAAIEAIVRFPERGLAWRR